VTGEQFALLQTASYGEVLRGVAFTPGTGAITPPSLPVTVGGFVYGRVTKTYSATVTVVNNTTSPVSGPISVEFSNLSPGVTLVSTNPLPVLASGGSLAPGQSATATVVLSDPTNAPITLNAQAIED
jgi:hypothetical protein